jgi:UTP--glucose-1-phosphate uridylyltransferase
VSIDARAISKAVIPAAGLGTRFLPASKAIPKEMLPIVDVPTIQLVVDEAVRAGITDVIVVNGRGKGAIEDHFDHAYELEHVLRARGNAPLADAMAQIATMVRIHSVRQKQPLGLGHAVACARQAVGDEPFAVLLGDDLYDDEGDPAIAQLARARASTGAAAIAIVEVPAARAHQYGVVAGDFDASGRVLRVREIVEKPKPGTAPSVDGRFWTIVGRYVLPPEIFEHLARTKPGAGGEIQLTDALRELVAAPAGMIGVVVAATRHDAGDRLGYLRANLAYALKRPELRDAVIALCREIAQT